MSVEDRAIVARIGAYAMHARYDPRETTSAARAGWNKKFVDEVDPDRVLPEGERNRRAEAALRAHMTRLALKSARARRRR